MNLLKIQDERYLQTPPLVWHRWLMLFLYFSFASLLIFLGAKILVQNGFLGQNFIYLVFIK